MTQETKRIFDELEARQNEIILMIYRYDCGHIDLTREQLKELENECKQINKAIKATF